MTVQNLTTPQANGSPTPSIPAPSPETILATCEDTLWSGLDRLVKLRATPSVHAITQAIAIIQQERSAILQEQSEI